MKVKIALLFVFFIVSGFSWKSFSQSKKRSFYEIKIYHLQSKTQEGIVDQYLKDAFIPALNRKGINDIGVFKPIGNDTSRDMRIYVLIAFKTAKQYADLPEDLVKDRQYKETAKPYLDAGFKTPPYKRIESIFLKAFADMPILQVPTLKNSSEKRVYELRSYESPTEQIHQNKVKMFNAGGEIRLFQRLNFNAVFYGSVIAGSHTPNLMYMTSFEDMADREEHWKAFRNDPEWKKLSSDPYYKNNVSKNEILFLHPTDYSGI